MSLTIITPKISEDKQLPIWYYNELIASYTFSDKSKALLVVEGSLEIPQRDSTTPLKGWEAHEFITKNYVSDQEVYKKISTINCFRVLLPDPNGHQQAEQIDLRAATYDEALEEFLLIVEEMSC